MRHGRISALFLALAMTVGAQNLTHNLKVKPGGGLAFANEDGSATLNIGGKIQIRHTYEERSDSSYFQTPRVELGLKGSFQDDWKWELLSDFSKKERATLKEAFVEHVFGEGLQLRAGQYKVGFDRQQFESSGRQTFVDVSLASASLGKGRDQGVQAHGSFLNRMFQYNAGVFNGTGEGTPNTNTGHMTVARVSFNPLGDFGLSQGDIVPSSTPRVYADLSAYHNQDDGGSPDGTTGVAVGTGLRYAGAYAAGEYIHRETSAGVTSGGIYAQASCMILPGTLEAGARYSQLDPDTGTGNDLQNEITAVVNVFFHNLGHNLKFSADLSLLKNETETSGDENSLRTRVQMQAAF